MPAEDPSTPCVENKLPGLEESAADAARRLLPPVRLGRALRSGLRLVWDRLGLILGISLTWTALLSLPLTIWWELPATVPVLTRMVTALLTALFTLPAATAGVCYVAHLVCAHEEVAYVDLWRGGARLFGPATRLGLIQAGVGCLFGCNLWFYTNVGHRIGLVAFLVCLYALLFWSMMSVYHGPLLVAQETGVFDTPARPARRGACAVLRRAFFLALGNPFLTLGLLAALLLLTALLSLTRVLPLLLWPGMVALLTTQTTRALLVRYGVLPPPSEEEPVPDALFRLQEKRGQEKRG